MKEQESIISAIYIRILIFTLAVPIFPAVIISCSPVKISCPQEYNDRISQDHVDYKIYDQILKECVNKDGLVNYRKLKAKKERLKSFLEGLKCIGPSTTPQLFTKKEEKIAFWINVYNAASLLRACELYPCKTVRPLFGDFEETTKVSVDAKVLSLKQIKNIIIDISNEDKRLLLALKRPAFSSGRFPNYAFDPERLDSMINKLIKDAIDDPYLLRIDHTKKELQLGEDLWQTKEYIIRQYKELFDIEPPSFIDALSLYAEPIQRIRLNTAIGYKLVKQPFNWQLNDGSDPPCSIKLDNKGKHRREEK